MIDLQTHEQTEIEMKKSIVYVSSQLSYLQDINWFSLLFNIVTCEYTCAEMITSQINNGRFLFTYLISQQLAFRSSFQDKIF